MKKDWIAVKDEIEREIDAIWLNEPIEVAASSRGLFPSCAGSHGMATGNLLYQIADTFAAGFGDAAEGMQEILCNDSYTLDQAKSMFPVLYGGLAMHMGGRAKNGAAWLNLPKVWTFYQDILGAMDSITEKDMLASLVWSWKNYLKRLNIWFSLCFTWEVIGNLRRSKQVSDYEALLDLTLRTEPYMKNAAESRI